MIRPRFGGDEISIEVWIRVLFGSGVGFEDDVIRWRIFELGQMSASVEVPACFRFLNVERLS